MLPFVAVGKILDVTNEIVTIKKFRLQKVRVAVADLEIDALFDERDKVEIGEFVKGNRSYLTTSTGTDVVLQYTNVERITEEEFNECKYLELRSNGKLYKSDKAYLRKVGIEQKSFIPYTLIVNTNNARKSFKLFCVSFCRTAEDINLVENKSYVNVTGRLKMRRDGGGYELNVSDYEIV